METKTQFTITILIIMLCNGTLFAQCPNTGMPSTGASFWCRSGNSTGGTTLGTFFAAPINIFTGGTQKATFTEGSTLGGGSSLIPGIAAGDGLRILPGVGSAAGASLDMWTTGGGGNGTHIRWDGSGQISGVNSRLEIWATNNGFWFNTTAGTGRYIFNSTGTENGRIGTNRFWRIGDNPGGVNANRRLEVFDNAAAQLRLSNAGASITDFFTTGGGLLKINPSGAFTGFNLGTGLNPTHTIDVNGDARIRNVPVDATPNAILLGNPVTGGGGANDIEVQRLNFTGSSTDVLLGNGTWGPTPNTLLADNGATIVTVGANDFIEWGQIHSGTGALSGGELIHDTEIPFNGFNVFFPDPAASTVFTNRMQLGNNAGGFNLNALAKISAINGENLSFPLRIGSYFSTTNLVTSGVFPLQYHPHYFGIVSPLYKIGTVSIAGTNDGAINNRFIGISSLAFNNDAVLNIGTAGKAYGSVIANTGIYGLAGSPDPNSVNRGVHAIADEGGQNYGVYAVAFNGVGNYAVYGEVPGPYIPGTGTPPGPNYAAYFNGDVLINGTVGFPSDISLKHNIDTIPGAMNIITQLLPKKFEYNQAAYPSMTLQSGLQYGLIAQDVETILPELVTNNTHPAKYDTSGIIIYPEVDFKGLKYEQLIPILIKGIQEQQQTINSLNNQVQSLQTCIDGLGLCGSTSLLPSNSPENNTMNIELSDAQSIILDQNVPNPFAEQTTITYSLNQGVQKAQMLFYNAEGRLINSMDLMTRAGKSQLNVFANDLSNGVYTYTLVVDGKIIDTKRMVKNK